MRHKKIVIMENHLEKMGGILLGSKQKVISVKKYSKLLSHNMNGKVNNHLNIYLDPNWLAYYHVQFFTFRNSKHISVMKNWKKRCKKRVSGKTSTM